MKAAFTYVRLMMTFVVVSACVDPIEFPEVDPKDIIVLDGKITDDPGPYTVKIFRGLQLNQDSVSNIPVPGAKIVLHSDKGESEPLVQLSPGEYQTGGAIRGAIGSSYHLTIEMPDGATFESEPEKIYPAGHVTDIRYQYEARTRTVSYGVLPADVFNIFIDAEGPPEGTTEPTFVRWKFNGMYKVATNPELHISISQGFKWKTPFPCSGWVVDPAPNGGILRQQSECLCCTCYVQQFESMPRLSDTDLVVNGQFRNVKVAEVPITRATFFEKYRVEIEQMTISKNAFDFFKIIRAQKEGASNLFQPPPGKLTGNIRPVNADYEIVGLFWAASINRKDIYIHEADLPHPMAVDIITFPCTDVFRHSTTIKPDFWQ